MEHILKKFKVFYNKQHINIFFVTIISSLIIHFQLYALAITGPDTLINSIYHQADVWEVMLLRFGLFFVQMIKGNIVSPILVTLLSSIILGVTVNIVIDTLDINNKFFKYLICLLFVAAPNISSTLTFFYCSDAYILGLLLASLAVFLVRKYDKKWIVLISGLLIMLSISMYQTYLSVTLVLCITTLLIDILNKKDLKQVISTFLKYLVMVVIGVVLFYVVSHLIVMIFNLQVSSYSGANSIGFSTLTNFPKLSLQAYQSFFNYFFNDKLIHNTIWGTNIFYIIMFLIMTFSILYIITKNKLYNKKLYTMLVFVLIFIAPLCFGLIEIVVPDVDIHILMACSMIFIFPIFFKLLELLPNNTISKIITFSITFCSICIIWIYTWQDNASYSAIKLMQNQSENTVSRIVTQIEQLDEYSPEMPVLFLGGLRDNPYLNRMNTSIETKKIIDRSWGFICEEPTIWWGNLDSWTKILYEYEGVNFHLVSEWDSSQIFETEDYKNMKYYPEKDSIKVINNTVVVKLSD